MPSYRWILAAAGLSLCGFCFEISEAADARFAVESWGTDKGLPQSSVFAMTQTRDGYLWLGTLNGLARFDGVRFTVFDESNTRGLNSSRIVHLFEDSQGNLWIGTETAGVALVKDGQVKSLDIGRGSREGRLVASCEDSDGAVWLYTADGQLCRYRKGSVDIWQFGAQYPSSCRRVIAEKSGPMWVGVNWGLYGFGPAADLAPRELPLQQVLPVAKLDFLLASQRGGYWRLADGHVQHWRTNRLERDLGPYPWNRSAVVAAACEDHQGNLAVGTYGEGVYWFDVEGKVTRLSGEQGLSHSYILSLCADREGCLWVGTDGGGLNRVKRQVFNVLPGSQGATVQSVCQDGGTGLWINYGDRLEHRSEGVSEQFGPTNGLTNLLVRTVFVDRSQHVWAGTYGGGLLQLQDGVFRQAPGSEIINRGWEVSAIHQDRRGWLWVGSQGGVASWDGRNWKLFTTSDKLSSDAVRAIADDAEGNLWIGTEWGGLNRLRDGKFTAYRKSEDGLPSDNISSLHIDNEGVLWIGTGGGLAKFQEGKWTRYTTREGLINNGVGYLIEDGQGYLWIGSSAGLVRVKKKALNDFARGLTTFIPFRAYGKLDGLPTSECAAGSQPGACCTGDGTLWFPTIKGLVSINPARLNPNTNPPPVVIESVMVEGQEQNTNSFRAGLLQSVTVPAGKERLEIHFTSLNLAAPEQARFRYQLEGHETGWTEAPGNSRPITAVYTKLPPGNYRFRVTACNEDGLWNEMGSLLPIIVEPPFWQKWWFRGMTVVCLLGAIIAVVHYLSTQKLQRQLESLRQQEAIEKERARIARDLHDQLGANLTQVALLSDIVESDKDSAQEVEAHAQQISQTARETTRALDEIVWATNPANDTLDGLITYACKYAQEYLGVAGLRHRLDVPAELPATTIPPDVRHNVFLAFKEAVNNVVKHAQASEIRIRLRAEPAHFTLEIEDNGRGLADSHENAGQTGNGLKNMRKRMADVGGSFSIGPAPEQGTLVRLTAPMQKS